MAKDLCILETANSLSRSDQGILQALLYGVAVFNIADYFFTNLALSMGYRELNPFIDMIVGTVYFPLLKLVVIPLLLYFVWSQRCKVGSRVLLYAWVAFLVYLGLMFYFKIITWIWVL